VNHSAQGCMADLRFRNHGWHREVWPRWVAYTTAGYLVNGIAMTALPTRAPLGSALALVAVVMGVAMVGFSRWLVLRRCAHSLRWWSWVLATVFGQFAATVVVTLAVVGSLISGAVWLLRQPQEAATSA
jgi:uncharacterized membrane protein YbhN (UPF0104 family)